MAAHWKSINGADSAYVLEDHAKEAMLLIGDTGGEVESAINPFRTPHRPISI
jgi:hypothetical protein